MCKQVRLHDVIIATSIGAVRTLSNGLFYCPGILIVAFRDDLNVTFAVASWIPAILHLSYCILCVVGGFVVKQLSSRVIAMVGAVVMIGGLVATIFVSDVVQMLLTFGIVTGAGSGLNHIGSLGALNHLLKRHRDLYFGITSFLGTVGVAIYAPMLQYLIDAYTWRGMVLVLAGLQMNAIAVALLFPYKNITKSHRSGDDGMTKQSNTQIRSSNSEQKAELLDEVVRKTDGHERNCYATSDLLQQNCDVEHIELQGSGGSTTTRETEIQAKKCSNFFARHVFLRELQFYFFLSSVALFFFSCGVVLGHLVAYSVFNGISDKMGASVYYTINMVSSGFSRVIHGVVLNTGKINAETIYIGSTMFCGLTTFVLLWKVPYAVVCIYVLTLGPGAACIGGVVCPAIIFQLGKKDSFEIGMGMFILSSGIGYVIGTPLAGWMFDMTQSYMIPFAMAAVAMIMSSILMILFVWYSHRSDVNRRRQD